MLVSQRVGPRWQHGANEWPTRGPHAGRDSVFDDRAVRTVPDRSASITHPPLRTPYAATSGRRPTTACSRGEEKQRTDYIDECVRATSTMTQNPRSAGIRHFVVASAAVMMVKRRNRREPCREVGGHFRTGILTAPLTGRIIAELAAGEPPPYPVEPFLLSRFDGEPRCRAEKAVIGM